MRVWLMILGVVTAAILQKWASHSTAMLPALKTEHEQQRLDGLVAPIVLTPSRQHRYASRAEAHPHGEKLCASGCALSRHPTERLTKQRFDRLIQRLVVDADDAEAIDELLYFGPQSALALKTSRTSVTNFHGNELIQKLKRELSRRHAIVELRLVAESGNTLADLPAQTVPMDIRHEFDLHEHGIPQLLASGTVKRVGRYRLWCRL